MSAQLVTGIAGENGSPVTGADDLTGVPGACTGCAANASVPPFSAKSTGCRKLGEQHGDEINAALESESARSRSGSKN